jgi:thiol:disulfide interchange protein DsbD
MSELIQQFPHLLVASPLLALMAAYAAGVMVSAEPCLYTVIPITVGFIGARSEGSRIRAFVLSLLYVLGLATTYTALGLAAALTGSLFGQMSANPWVNLVLANILIALGLSMLDVFELPSFGAHAAGPRRGRGALTAYVLGLSSGFVAGPCTAAVLGMLLTFAATSGNVIYGGLLLFVFSIGMGTLLLAAGTFAGVLSSLPKPGPWMAKIRHFFGYVIIAAAEYFLIMAGKLMLQ